MYQVLVGGKLWTRHANQLRERVGDIPNISEPVIDVFDIYEFPHDNNESQSVNYSTKEPQKIKTKAVDVDDLPIAQRALRSRKAVEQINLINK